MDKMSMEELGFFLYMEEMVRRQREEEQAARDGEEGDTDDE